MLDGARSGEAERAGPQCFLQQFTHLRDFFVFRHGGMVGAALPHDIKTQGGMRHLRADIDDFGRGFERVEIVGKGFPVEFHAFGEHGPGNVFHAFHQVDEVGRCAFAHRSKTHTAVSEHDRGHAMPGRRREIRVPGGLTVVMRMDIDEARRDQQSARIDFAAPAANIAADRRDEFAVDRYIGNAPRRTRAVDDRAVADDDIVHAVSPDSM